MSESLISQLHRIGLNDAQAKVYLFVLEHGESRINTLAAGTQLPRSSVYESVKHLLAIGLAEEIVVDSFKLLRAYPLSNLSHSLQEQRQQLEELEKQLPAIEKLLPSPTQATSARTARVRYYQGKTGARQLLWNTLKAKDTVLVYSSWGRGRYVGMKFYENFVTTSQERQIREQVLINPSERVLESIYTHLGSPTARTRLEDIRSLPASQINIQGETFIYNDTYAQIYLKGENIEGFEIDSPQFVTTQSSIFQQLWSQAKPLISSQL